MSKAYSSDSLWLKKLWAFLKKKYNFNIEWNVLHENLLGMFFFFILTVSYRPIKVVLRVAWGAVIGDPVKVWFQDECGASKYKRFGSWSSIFHPSSPKNVIVRDWNRIQTVCTGFCTQHQAINVINRIWCIRSTLSSTRRLILLHSCIVS